MVSQKYPHSILSTILDSDAANLAFKMGVGSLIKTSIGGKLDDRFKPLILEFEVISINDLPLIFFKFFNFIPLLPPLAGTIAIIVFFF